MPDLTPSDIVFQNAGKYLRWQTQETGSTAVNGTPTAGNSGISVLGSQKAKIAVTPNSGATLSFRVWIEYEGRQGFYLADGFTRGGIDTAWTQEINTSGASRLYVEITAIDTGSFDVEMAVAEIPDGQLQRVRRITDWADAGTGVEGEQVILENASGQEAVFKWDNTNSNWVLESTFGQAFLIDDWTGGSLDPIWNLQVDNTPSGPTFNGGANQLEITYASGEDGAYRIRLDPHVAEGALLEFECSLGGLTQPSVSRPIVQSDIIFQGSLPNLQTHLQWREVDPSARTASYVRQTTSTDFNPQDSGLDTTKVYKITAGAKYYNDTFNVLFYRGDNVTDGTLLSQERVPTSFDDSTFLGEPGEIQLEINNSAATFTGGPYTYSIGRVWIRR